MVKAGSPREISTSTWMIAPSNPTTAQLITWASISEPSVALSGWGRNQKETAAPSHDGRGFRSGYAFPGVRVAEGVAIIAKPEPLSREEGLHATRTLA